jgi:ABC-type branched-subunit amino acid transport system ATPase component
VLAAGRVVMSGPPADLLAKPEFASSYLGV